MASVANRRNPLVFLDLVRSHALLFFRQRPAETLENGTLVVTATVEDFEYATGLFGALHAGSGSLGSKFDRDDDRVLAEAARRSVERFTVADVQRWMGWSYDKAYRTMKATRAAAAPPGLLDRSPALSLVDQTVIDPDGADRDVRQHRLVLSSTLKSTGRRCSGARSGSRRSRRVPSAGGGARVMKGLVQGQKKA